MKDNTIFAIFGAITILCLSFAFYIDIKSQTLQKELLFIKEGLSQKVIEGKVIWTKP